MNPISFPLVLLAGLLSFLSPCVLPLVPIYLGYLSGSSVSGDPASNQWQVFSHALFFVVGFTLVFVILFGLPTTILANVLQQYRDWITRIGGAVLILFGLHTMGIVTIPILNMTRRVDVGTGMKQGYTRSALLGVTFAAGWTPCIGPLLGTVMTLSFAEPSRALVFIFTYAMGLAIPFLLTAALLARAAGWLKRLNQHMRAVEIVSGLLMVGVGVLLITGTFSVLNSYFIRITPEWLLQYLYRESVLSGINAMSKFAHLVPLGYNKANTFTIPEESDEQTRRAIPTQTPRDAIDGRWRILARGQRAIRLELFQVGHPASVPRVAAAW